jgi:26S proteasome non-ATPase regulatory subunit 10
LESGAKVDAKNKDNQTALMWAARCGFKELAILLIGHGADVEERDSSGITALSSAIKEGRKDLSEVLSIMISRL